LDEEKNLMKEHVDIKDILYISLRQEDEPKRLMKIDVINMTTVTFSDMGNTMESRSMFSMLNL
jgi:hypothetical protein